MMTPIQLLNEWIDAEKKLGAEQAQHAVLSTQGLHNQPHARIVALREVSEEHLLFFTQQRTRKVAEIKNNNQVCLTFWFERHAREVVIEGEASFLSNEENTQFWSSYPQWAQIRFCSYAPSSSSPIESKDVLEQKRLEIEQQWKTKPIPLSPDYCGIRIKPLRFIFYTYRSDELSDVWEYQLQGTDYKKQRLSP